MPRLTFSHVRRGVTQESVIWTVRYACIARAVYVYDYIFTPSMIELSLVSLFRLISATTSGYAPPVNTDPLILSPSRPSGSGKCG